MRFYLQHDESVIWKARSAYPFRYPLLATIFFFGILLVLLGPVGIALAAISLLLFFGFSLLTFVALLRYPRTKYYVTNKRIVSDKMEMPLENLEGTRIHQTSLNRVRKIGDLYFDSAGYSWLVFKRIKNPESVGQYALSAKASLPKPLPRAMAPSQVVARPSFEQNIQQPSTTIREREVIIRETVVLCSHCGTRTPQGMAKCSNCGARI